ncbi:MAG: hypothetical protein F4Z66_00635 [Gammaproteobacteria bacterium]|nr:hypothetical protein [Gammaproteobacteria bacterium]
MYLSRLGRMQTDFYSQGEGGKWNLMSDEDVKDFVSILSDGGIGLEDKESSKDVATRRWYVEPVRELQADSTYDLFLGSGAKSIFASESS